MMVGFRSSNGGDGRTGPNRTERELVSESVLSHRAISKPSVPASPRYSRLLRLLPQNRVVMGTAVAVTVADGLQRRLESRALRWGLPSMLCEGMIRMKRPLFKLQFMLSMAESEELSVEMGAAQRKIKEVIYELEDLLDELEDRCNTKHQASRHGRKLTLFWPSSQLLFHINVALRMKTISRKLDAVARDSVIFSLQEHTSPNPEQSKELLDGEEILSHDAKLFVAFKEIYYSMPLALKSCFLYLAVFPKGCNICKDELIQQWTALDLLESNHGIIPAYILGERYIQHLLSVSFLQIPDISLATEMKHTNAPVILRMDDMVHEFVRFISRDDLLSMDYKMVLNGCIEKLPFRYAVLTNYSGQYAMQTDLLAKAKAVHFKKFETINVIADTFSVLRYSRIIDLSGCPFVELPASIGQLKHLRYLNVSDSRIRALPNEMACLQNLESLNLAETYIEVLPVFIGTFQKLKYFNLHGCDKLQNLPPTLGDLKRLEHLNLSCCTGICELPLSLCGLHKLRFLDLSGCTKLEELPHSFGNLECLEDLSLAGCSRLKQLPRSLGDLTFLMSLNLESCCELKQLPESIQRLHTLDLTGCILLKSLDMPQSHATCIEIDNSLSGRSKTLCIAEKANVQQVLDLGSLGSGQDVNACEEIRGNMDEACHQTGDSKDVTNKVSD